MELKIIAIGKVKDRALLQKCDEYAAKIAFDAKLEIVEIKDSDKEAEGAKIVDNCARDRTPSQIIVLDEHGKHFSSVAFAERLRALNKKVTFILGGPYGLSQKVRDAAHETMSLSAMTFTHEMSRMVLLEQLYRAISIIKNRKYHNE